MSTTTPQLAKTEAAIFGRVVQPNRANLSAAAARAILELRFDQADIDQMRVLSDKARQGTLTPVEQEEINNYERVGHMLALMKSKARRSLKLHDEANGKRKTR